MDGVLKSFYIENQHLGIIASVPITEKKTPQMAFSFSVFFVLFHVAGELRSFVFLFFEGKRVCIENFRRFCCKFSDASL
ncbi:MAG: hypothetical protein IKO57_06830 [Treponema sp.]|nr:hypothetical protein [Treponema sp.]